MSSLLLPGFLIIHLTKNFLQIISIFMSSFLTLCTPHRYHHVNNLCKSPLPSIRYALTANSYICSYFEDKKYIPKHFRHFCSNRSHNYAIILEMLTVLKRVTIIDSLLFVSVPKYVINFRQITVAGVNEG
jgi:hypothetical protein